MTQDIFSRLRGPGRVVRNRLPQERPIWSGEIQPSPFVGRTRNKSDRVIIDDTSITVDSPDGTVIIDGSSNMFKILASGTVSKACPNNSVVTNDVGFPSLGDWTTIPICIGGISFSNSIALNTRQMGREILFQDVFVALSSGGAVTEKSMSVEQEASLGSGLIANPGTAYVRIGASNQSGSSFTAYGRYHLCQEASI